MDTKITVKTSLGKDTRRLSIPASELSIQRLNEMLMKFFGKNTLNSYSKLYVDPEGDEISLKNELDLKEAVDIALQSGSNVIRILLKPSDKKKENPPPPKYKIILNEEISGILDNPNQSLDEIINNNEFILEKNQEVCNSNEGCGNSNEGCGNSNEGCGNSNENKDDNPGIMDSSLGRGMNKLTNEFIYLTKKYSIENLNIPIEEIRKKITILLDELYGHSSERHFRSNIATESFKSFQKKIIQSTSSQSSVCLSHYKSQVTDISLPAESQVVKNSKLKKIWRVTNNGSHVWPPGVTLSHIAGDIISYEPLLPIQKEVKPGESIDIELNFTVPEDVGRYISHFKLTTPDDMHFGQRLFLDIVSIENELNNLPEDFSEKVNISSETYQEADPTHLGSDTVEILTETQHETTEVQETNDDIYIENLQRLSDMGFDDIDLCLELLKMNNNNFDTVLDELLSQ